MLPSVLLAILIEYGFAGHIVLAEHLLDKFLVLGREVTLLAIEPVVFPATEVGYQFAFQGWENLVRHVVQQLADSPCHAYLLRRLEVAARAVVLGEAEWVDDADRGIVRRIVECGQAMQTVVGFSALGIETTSVVVGGKGG